MKTCSRCGEDGNGGIWCPHCNRAYDLAEAQATLRSIKWSGFTGSASTNPKVEEFVQTGDPAVFAKPGALDYRG